MPTTTRIHNSTLLFLQGIILIVFSIFIFSRPQELLEKLVYVAGLTAICMAFVFFGKYFFGEAGGRIFPDLFTAFALMGMGFMLLKANLSAREWFLVSMSGLLLLLAANVLLTAWEMKYVFKWWWLSVLTGLLSMFNTFLIISDRRYSGMPVSLLIAIQVLLLGLLMIWLSILNKREEKEYRTKLKDLRN